MCCFLKDVEKYANKDSKVMYPKKLILCNVYTFLASQYYKKCYSYWLNMLYKYISSAIIFL